MLQRALDLCVRGFTNLMSYAGYHPGDPRIAAMWGFGTESASGITINTEISYTYSAVYNAIDIISSAMALMPCEPVKWNPKSRTREIAYDHWLYPIMMESPNPEQTAFEFRWQLQADAFGWGWGVAEKQFNLRGQVVYLWRLEPWAVTETRNNVTDELEYEYTDPVTGKHRKLDPDSLFIIRCPFTKSPIRLAREAVGLGLAAERFGASFFGKGARTSGALTHDKKLSPDAKRNIREDWMLWNGGVKNALYPLVLDENVKYQPFTIAPDEAQFLETRQFQVIEMARWFNLPPHMLKEMDRATWDNVEMGQIEFRTVTIQPWVTRWQQNLNRALLNRNDRGAITFQFDMDALVYGNMETRQKGNEVKFRNGIITIDDWMVEEGYNPVGGDIGKSRFCMVNMQTVEQAMLAQKAAKKTLENLENGLDATGASPLTPPNDDGDDETPPDEPPKKKPKKSAEDRFSRNGTH